MSRPTDPDLPPDDGLFPIRHVCAETGVNPVTLRAWERRYGLIRPLRTPKGHRLYSTEDIARIKRILALLDEGVAVSQVGRVLERNPRSGPAAPPHPDRRNGNGQDAGTAPDKGSTISLQDPVAGALLDASRELTTVRLERSYARLVMRHGWEGVHEHAFLNAYHALREEARRDPAAEARLAVFATWANASFAEQLRSALLLCEGPTCPALTLGSGHRRVAGMLFLLASARQGLRVLPLLDVVSPEALQRLVDGVAAPAITVYLPSLSAQGLDRDRVRELLDQDGIPCFAAGPGARELSPLHGNRQLSLLPESPLEAADVLTRALLGPARA
ncbi:putative transcriptional regulator, MerR family [Thioalkalivibrio nitratireducens DSM 14787]|uniref:Transcriptional regulator, MerR family n=1 Tax=Thioalkalivibrio nitratireducens (strain DSM 14787 / UNIQEM 213 / ALEN2) TaxID=1255043 RepID=L0DYB1_THIND|nr:MerR family transcriptional regulator [Thioalkalivibrio nitratireducens]AGA34033.1 putative transcriptional regulator, MerR family [Thioalkalivibrio nitratireducens DSM 14787]